MSGEMIEEGIPIANVSKPGDRYRVNLLVIPKRGGKSEQVFEQDFWSVKETNLWPRKMGREVQEQRRKIRKEERVTVDLLNRAVLAKQTDEGLRALSGESPIHPESVQKYLEGKFGDALEDVSNAMLGLAKSLPPAHLAQKAFSLYDKFRPEIIPGKKGWGPPATWTWTSSARWLRPDPEEHLLNSSDLYLIRQTGPNKAMTRFSTSQGIGRAIFKNRGLRGES